MSIVTVADDRRFLPPDYELQSYKLSKVIGRGSYGITYLASDRYLNRKVAIKEYLPREYATRNQDLSISPISDNEKEMFEWGLNNFLLEARTLAKFNHPNIIKVIGVVEQNNTAYMIMEFEEGSDLSNIYRERVKFDEKILLHYFVPIIEGLSVVHKQGFIHRDIKPANIYVRSDTSTVLLDFGSARQTVETDTDVLTTLVTAGFAPYEQYHHSKYDQGPWSDIYSLGATLYFCMTGSKPADALVRGSSLLKNSPDPYISISQIAKGDYSTHFMEAVDQALSFNIEDRPNNAMLWSKMLSGTEPVRPPTQESLRQIREQYPRTIPMNSNSLASMDVVIASKNTTLDLHADTAKLGQLKKSATNSLRSINFISRLNKASIAAYASLFLLISAIPISLLISPSFRDTLISTFSTNGGDVDKPSSPDNKKLLAELASIELTNTTSGKIATPANHDSGNKPAQIELSDKNTGNRDSVKNTSAQTIKTPNAESTVESINNSPVINEDSKANSPQPSPSSEPSSDSTTTKSANAKINRQNVVELAEQVVIKDLFAQAETAIAKKRYSVPPKDNAIYHYNKILTLQPNNIQAKTGLKDIEKRYIEIVEKYIDKHNWRIAKRNIHKISTLSKEPNTALIRKLNTQLENRKQKSVKITHALNQANYLYEKSRLTKPKKENALHYYFVTLKLDPGNSQAESKIESIYAKLSIVLNKQIKAKRVKKAKRTYTVLKSIHPESKFLSKALPVLNKLQIDYDQIQKLIRGAEADFVKNRISLPKNNSALTKYLAVLKIDKDSNQAKSGIKRIFTYYVSNYYRQIDNNNFTIAKRTLKTLEKIGYGKKKLATLRKFAKLEKKTRINTEIIQRLLSKIENGLNARNLKTLDKISIFTKKKRKFISDLMNNYSDYSVSIVNKIYSQTRNRTTARVVLSSLEAADEDQFVIPEDIKISIKVKKNKSKKWKVYW